MRIIAKPFKAEAILEALKDEEGLWLSHVEEVKGYTEVREEFRSFYRESEFKIDYLPKSYVSIICEDDKQEKVIAILEEVARTAEVGDGKIFVMPVNKIIDIGSGKSSSENIV